jgi:hypothetical protein
VQNHGEEDVVYFKEIAVRPLDKVSEKNK